MILFDIPSTAELHNHIPLPIMETAHSYEIVDTKVTKEQRDTLPEALRTAQAWIGCRQALPHTDYEPGGRVYFMVSMMDTHDFWESSKPDHYWQLRAGSVFIIEPGVAHALFDRNSHTRGGEPGPWIGLSWTVSVRMASLLAESIRGRYGNPEWHHATDERRVRYMRG